MEGRVVGVLVVVKDSVGAGEVEVPGDITAGVVPGGGDDGMMGIELMFGVSVGGVKIVEGVGEVDGELVNDSVGEETVIVGGGN